MEIAFIGMGLMGAPMALNCLKAGHDVVVYNRTGSKTEPLRAAGAGVAPTPAEAVRGRREAHICVEDSEDVEAVIFGAEGLVAGLPRSMEPPVVIVDHSTISPLATERMAQRLKREHGVLYLDAPVSGGTTGAAAGTLTIMCGGPTEAFERAAAVLEAMGKTIVHVGRRNGDGQRAKLINQVVVAINCIATTEAMRLGEAMGVEMGKVLEAITQGAAGSWSLTNLGPAWLSRNFAPGFRLRHLLKDLRHASTLLEQLPSERAVQFPGVELALEMVQRAVETGHGDENIHAMGRVFEEKGVGAGE